MKYLIPLLLLLAGCTYPQITMSELNNHTGEYVEVIGSFFDDYNNDYKQFADSEAYIYVETKGNFTYREIYLIRGKVEECQISNLKKVICLKASEIKLLLE